jgi:hypothetical protein
MAERSSTAAVDERVVPSAAAPERATSAVALSLPAAAALAALAVGVVGQGAYHAPVQRVVGMLLAVAGAGLVLDSRGRTSLLRQPVAGACALFGAWAIVRALLDGNPGAARSTVLLLAGVIVIVLTGAACGDGQRAQLLAGVLALGAVVAFSGWVGVAWRWAPWALEDQGLWRAATTITYANVAAGLLAAITLVSVARTAAQPRPTALLTAVNCVLLTGTGATLSRGGALALAAGALVLAGAIGLRAITKTVLAPAIGAGLALAGLAPSMPAGSPARPVLAACTLVLGLLVAVWAARLTHRTFRVVMVAGVCAAILMVFEGPQLLDAGSALVRPRLTVSSPDRAQEIRAALRALRSEPLLGVGQGDANLTWLGADGSLVFARYAHNEYLQVLAELGVVGLGLLLGVLAVAGRTLARGRHMATPPEVWAGVTAALVALAVHGLFDFGWHVPALPLAAALLLGLVTFPKRKEKK